MKSLRSLVIASALLSAFAAPAFAQMQGGPLQNGTPVAPSVQGGDSLSGVYFGTNRVGVTGHLESANRTTNPPVLSACGTTPALAAGSTDTQGSVTMGTTATGCVISFFAAYTVAPSCVVSWRATPLASQSYVVAAASITTTQTSASNNVLDYVCFAKTGG